ncbi:MAG: diacylglycerol kinase family lipid kinase [Spirochaetia bacterium]|nr:diacylglycerol kinase family lipid kinase [Spirochaetia bacterium]
MKILFIINRHAGSGKADKKWPKIEKKIKENFKDYSIVFTEKKGHAVEISRKAVQKKIPLIVAGGGDGTISETAAGFIGKNGKPLQTPSARSTMLGILPLGSGCDFIRTLNIPNDIEKSLEIIKKQKRRIIDMGTASFINHQGKKEKRPFINISDAGIGAQVMHVFDGQTKVFGAFISYQLATLRGLIQFTNKHFKIVIDNKKIKDEPANTVLIANGKYFGSGMKVAPDAKIDDGFFDVIVLDKMSRLKMLLKMPALQKGKYKGIKEINLYKAQKVKVETTPKAYIELDGEQLGATPIEFEIIKSAIPVIAP